MITQIKETKSVRMFGDENQISLILPDQEIVIPMKCVFQVKRGLESYIQKFYRRKPKKVEEGYASAKDWKESQTA